MNCKKRIILGVTGSIAAYKSADILRGLQKKGAEVSVVMTRNAEQFITPLTLSSLSGKTVYREMFYLSGQPESIVHIGLAQNADLLLIAPATASIIGKIANGIADDLLTCIAITTKAPIVIAPAMNTEMYKNVFVQENIKKLKKAGFNFVDPIKGMLACGDVGQGHLAEVEDIVEKALQFCN